MMFKGLFYRMRRNLDMIQSVKGWEQYEIQYEKNRQWGYSDDNTISILHLRTNKLIQLDVIESREVGFVTAMICKGSDILSGGEHVRVFENQHAIPMPVPDIIKHNDRGFKDTYLGRIMPEDRAIQFVYELGRCDKFTDSATLPNGMGDLLEMIVTTIEPENKPVEEYKEGYVDVAFASRIIGETLKEMTTEKDSLISDSTTVSTDRNDMIETFRKQA